MCSDVHQGSRAELITNVAGHMLVSVVGTDHLHGIHLGVGERGRSKNEHRRREPP